MLLFRSYNTGIKKCAKPWHSHLNFSLANQKWKLSDDLKNKNTQLYVLLLIHGDTLEKQYSLASVDITGRTHSCNAPGKSDGVAKFCIPDNVKSLLQKWKMRENLIQIYFLAYVIIIALVGVILKPCKASLAAADWVSFSNSTKAMSARPGTKRTSLKPGNLWI